MEIHEVAAIAVATVLGIDALIHAYWMTGLTWPARDARALSRVVLNTDVPFTPPVLAPLVVVLGVGAVMVLIQAGLLDAWLPAWLPGWIPTAGTLAVAVGTFLRAAAGMVWVAGVGASRDSVFYRLNLTVYTPICLIVCGAATTAVLAHG
jgi:hypothetical protein